MSDRIALIIANSEYEDPKLAELRTPGRNAEALAEVLGDPARGNFQVTSLVNEGLPQVREEIERLYQRKKKDDLLLLYFAGHGLKDDYGDLYLAVKGTKTSSIGATSIEADFIRRQLDRSNSQRKIVILDCCYSGAFERGAMAADSVGSGAVTQEVFEGRGYGRVVMTASNAIEYAWEGDKLLGESDIVETSVFTRFLVEGMRTGAADLDVNGEISHDELYDYVYEKVVKSGESRQTPKKLVENVEGRIIIAKNPIEPAELPVEYQREIESPFASVREGMVKELNRLLHSEEPAMALAAREALLQLSNDPDRQVAGAANQVLADLERPETELTRPESPKPPRTTSFWGKIKLSERKYEPAPDQSALLALWNPFGYLRLLWWMLISPAGLKEYRAKLSQHGANRLEKQGIWLTSSLTWWPMLALAYLVWLDTQEGPNEIIAVFSLGLITIIIGAWLLAGWWGYALDEDELTLLVSNAALVIAFITAAIMIISGTADLEPAAWLAAGAALAIFIGMSQSAAFGVQAGNVGLVGAGVALGVVSAVAPVMLGGGAVEAGVNAVLAVAALALIASASAGISEQDYGCSWGLIGGLTTGLIVGGIIGLLTAKLIGDSIPFMVLSLLTGVVAVSVVGSLIAVMVRRYK